MLYVRRSHEDWTCVFIAQFGIRQRRGKGLVACSGLINGIFGSGEERHIAAWKSKKVTTKFTEEETDGTTIIRERERFVQELSVVFATGPDYARWASDGGFARDFRRVRKRDSAGANSSWPGPRPTEQQAAGSADDGGSTYCGNPETASCPRQQIRDRPPSADRPHLGPPNPGTKLMKRPSPGRPHPQRSHRGCVRARRTGSGMVLLPGQPTAVSLSGEVYGGQGRFTAQERRNRRSRAHGTGRHMLGRHARADPLARSDDGGAPIPTDRSERERIDCRSDQRLALLGCARLLFLIYARLPKSRGRRFGTPWVWQSKHWKEWMLWRLERDRKVVSIFSTSNPQLDIFGWQLAQEARVCSPWP